LFFVFLLRVGGGVGGGGGFGFIKMERHISLDLRTVFFRQQLRHFTRGKTDEKHLFLF